MHSSFSVIHIKALGHASIECASTLNFISSILVESFTRARALSLCCIVCRLSLCRLKTIIVRFSLSAFITMHLALFIVTGLDRLLLFFLLFICLSVFYPLAKGDSHFAFVLNTKCTRYRDAYYGHVFRATLIGRIQNASFIAHFFP